ncbi:MAG: sensor histidine kinase [Thermodesulfobacteriota bacterium]
MLLLILLIFLVFRNAVKLFYERRRRIPGTRLRTKLIAAFVSLSLLPASVLFLFSLHFITTSIEFWFHVPIEKALEDSLSVGRNMYTHVEDNNRFFLDKVAYQVDARKLLAPRNTSDLDNYLQIVQREFNLDSVEVYNAAFRPVSMSMDRGLPEDALAPLDPEKLKKGLEGGATTWAASELLPSGELIRNISAIPFGAKGDDVIGFIVIGEMLPVEMAEHLNSISHGIGEYQQIKMLKQPIRYTYYISLTIVALLVMFCAIWFGMYLSKSITIPIMELAEGTRKVAEGDLSHTINVVADDEMKTLVDSFNKMTRDLRFNRREIEYSTRKLFEQNMEIEERRRYMEIVINNVSTGVISFDAHGLVTTVNASAERMLKINADNAINKNYKHLLKNQDPKMAEKIAARIENRREGSFSESFNMIIDGQRKTFKANFNTLEDESGRIIGTVMVFDDLTELEKAQRIAAWREVAKRIAHEVKNPLTPISLSAQRLKRKYQGAIDDPVFAECTRTIIDHTDMIRNLVNEFSSFARFPAANPSLCSLSDIINESVAMYREENSAVVFEVRMSEDIPPLNLDRQQIKQVMINLIDNALAAIKNAGTITIEARKDDSGDIVLISVADTGSGINESDKPYLFEPDYTTKKSGMGLGLAIVSTIIADHNGRVYAQDNIPRGAKFIIELPVG